MLLIAQSTQIVNSGQIDIMKIIPIVISTISLIISLLLALRTWWSERFKIDFEIVKWFGCNEGGHPIFLWLNIINKSKLPCSILEIKIWNKRHKQIIEGSGTGNKKLIVTTKTTGRDTKETYSLDYPININSYSSIGGYFHVFSKFGFHNFEDDWVKITIRTSRGSKTKKVFLDHGKNIYRVWQHNDPSIEVKIDKRSDGSTIEYLEDKDLI